MKQQKCYFRFWSQIKIAFSIVIGACKWMTISDVNTEIQGVQGRNTPLPMKQKWKKMEISSFKTLDLEDFQSAVMNWTNRKIQIEIQENWALSLPGGLIGLIN